MSKKHFIELADRIKSHNKYGGKTPFNMEHINTIADFCASANPAFKRDRFIDYILGNCGPSGGKVKS